MEKEKSKKTTRKKEEELKQKKEKVSKTDSYYETVGRRKTSVARVRLSWDKKEKEKIIVNDKPIKNYFPYFELQKIITAPLEKVKIEDNYYISVKIKGGGVHSQAEAIRHGIANALIKFNPEFRKKLKRAGYLTRDPRMRERKKFGLKRARRAPQWSKR